MAVDDEMEEYMIGDRVRDLIDNERATVLYVGLVPPTTGVWLGVNWDSNERGKHDGCNPKDGKRYFTASGPKSGSFVRPRKVSNGTRGYNFQSFGSYCSKIPPFIGTNTYFATGYERNRYIRMSQPKIRDYF